LHDTTPEQAVANAIHEALIYQPSLRNCIFPTCIREFDMTARMNGWEPVNPSWSGDGWHQAIRGISHGSICPDHVAVITDHMARPAELPNGRWTLSCACGWMPRPQTWGGLLKPLWEQHILTAAAYSPPRRRPPSPSNGYRSPSTPRAPSPSSTTSSTTPSTTARRPAKPRKPCTAAGTGTGTPWAASPEPS
ncbi:hypothetical protein ACFQ51_57030, partial [Streptomyces kaempferi]